MFRSDRAHRASYRISVGPIPPGILVCHKCDNPICVRPDHLFLGTARDNNVDRANKGRSKGTFTSGPDHPAKLRAGEHHWCRKISDADVAEMRRLTDLGASRKALGEQFNINSATVSRIVRGLWRKEAA
jgi:hypothetical protein